MNVLLTGYSGFIGSRVLNALLRADHRVLCAGRRRPPIELDGVVAFVAKDFMHDVDAQRWLPHLTGVDVVINAVGVLASEPSNDLVRVHTTGPIALFDACVAAGVRRVIQVSALGADEGAATEFHTSKRAADDHLRRLSVEHVIVQPSAVYGEGGASAALFATLASAPLIPLPGDGTQCLQPIHIEDVVDGILAAVSDRKARGTIPFVGPQPLTLRDFLAELRGALGLGHARFVRVPLAVVRCVARFGSVFRRGLLNDETLAMLSRGNVGDPAPLQRLLGRPARAVRLFVEPAARSLAQRDAQLAWLVPVARCSVAVMWLVSGVVSLGLYPVDSSLRLLATTGITTEWMALAALYGAAALDIAFGVSIFALRRRRWLWIAQIIVVLGYTAIISVRLPHLWLEPFGPVLKNLPVLAVLWLLYQTEDRRWNT
jgi:nucleoside-diphosphate-sugar epimerase